MSTSQDHPYILGPVMMVAFAASLSEIFHQQFLPTAINYCCDNWVSLFYS
ncbi:hypothetical protein Fmac_003068 [Flemingia macrophylla]|uniref:Uncharacterized protein n=1 Tax=Flemingia macrophylla TaxID=520843 RepID=A0ABD1NNJ5_9FABA